MKRGRSVSRSGAKITTTKVGKETEIFKIAFQMMNFASLSILHPPSLETAITNLQVSVNWIRFSSKIAELSPDTLQ